MQISPPFPPLFLLLQPFRTRTHLPPSSLVPLCRPPEPPSDGNAELQKRRDPQRRLHLRLTPTQPPGRDSADQDGRHSPDPPIPLDVLRQPVRQGRIGRNIVVHAGQHDRRDLIEPHEPTGGHLPAELEREERQRDQLEEQPPTRQRGIDRPVRDQVRLDQGRGDNDEEALDEERAEERAALAGAEAARRGGEGEGADKEGADGREGLEPAEGLAVREVGGAQAEEDGVSCAR